MSGGREGGKVGVVNVYVFLKRAREGGREGGRVGKGGPRPIK